ncbi:amidase [Rhodospirillum sp. A1_3_36]|uniref:amidase n=1 Tax=Rhodospirillum sp. A1_3_36 TaxID=3391666 RepID=UPI0039A4C0F2
MRFSDYASLDATALAAEIREGSVTPAEVLDTAIARAEAVQPVLNAIVHPFYDRARALVSQGPASGPFHGVPFVLKNTGLEMAGTPLSNGSRLFDDVVSGRDATLTARYLGAGLVPMGKGNTPEFALSFTTEPLAFGPTRNPWDLTRSPGGSSGGSAAAVAAGVVPMAHSSDGAGSTRVPAAHCGLVGFKPSRGRTPLGPVAMEAIAGMSTPHCVSRSVRDSAALLDATAGPDRGDSYAAPPAPGSFLSALDADPPPLRIAFTPGSPLGTPVDPQWLEATRQTAALCESLGHRVEEVDHAEYDAEALKRAWRIIVGVNIGPAVAAAGVRRGLADPLSGVEPVNAAWIRECQTLSATDYLWAVNQLHATARALGRFFDRYDVLLTPTTAEPPPLLGRMTGDTEDVDAFYDAFWAHAPFTCAFNASGCPAVSLPLGWSREGLPIGAHFGAAFGADALLFALSGQLERAAPWAARLPALPSLAPLETAP